VRTEKFRGILLSTLLVTSVIASLSIATLTHTSLPASAQEETYFIKECMPDLGQHCVNWCWAAAAANSIYWWSQHGYPELIDDPIDPVFPDNRYITDPLIQPPIPPYPPCPSGGYYRLLDEIAWDCGHVFCEGVLDNEYFYGLQRFIDEQGALLVVHEIVDPENVWAPPPPDGIRVIYRPPTLEDYQRELERCQDVLLWLNFRHYELYEDTDHVVTGVGFSYDNTWILVSDPWTPGAPDHNNLLDLKLYDNLPVINNDPLWVIYAGVPVQVSKMVYISPIEECGVEVTIEPWYQEGAPCENLYYDVTVHNTGTVVDSFTLSYIPNGWPDITIEPKVLEDIAPCESRVATLTVPVPELAEHCTEKEIVVIAESEFCGATDNDNAVAHVVVPTCGVEVTIEPKHKRGTPCTELTFIVSVHNTGDIPDDYLLSVVPDGWPMEDIILEYDVLLNVLPCETRTTSLYVHIPEDALPCTHKEIVVVAESEFCGATDNDNALVQVVSKYLHNIIEPGSPIGPGWPLDPGDWVCTLWHEIYPNYCQYYHLSSWEDSNGDGWVSPGDTIDITNLDNEDDIEWHYVKDVTCTLVLETEEFAPPETWWYLEFEDGWDNYCSAWWDPLGTQWNEIRPEFCNRYLLVDWFDTYEDGILNYCDWVPLVDKVTGEYIELHVVEIATDLVLCEEEIVTDNWTGTVDFSLVNLYTVNVEKVLDLYTGSKLVVKFYDYLDAYENENVIETFVPPAHVEENENARHPEGIGVKRARLVLTDGAGAEIATIATYTVTRSILFGRVVDIYVKEWPFATPAERSVLYSEIVDIYVTAWPFAPF